LEHVSPSVFDDDSGARDGGQLTEEDEQARVDEPGGKVCQSCA